MNGERAQCSFHLSPLTFNPFIGGYKMNDEMQKKYVEFQMMQQQLQQVQQQIQKLDAQVEELNNVIIALEDFKKMKTGAEMLVPLASGIFAYAELKDPAAVRVNVGSNVSVKKSIADTMELVRQQIVEIDKYKEQLAGNFMQLNQQLHHLQQELMVAAQGEESK